jgi:acetyl-CoA C-acetyltransferase
MRFDNVAIPRGLIWSSPFARWQGSLAGVNSLDLAVDVTTRALREADAPTDQLRGIVLGFTTPQKSAFYGGPTVAARIGAPTITGPVVSQACATSVAALHLAALQAQIDPSGGWLVCTTDRISNSPLMVYPSADFGGVPDTERWFADNINCDPWAGASMLTAAENVVRAGGFSRAHLDEVVLMRHQQYQESHASESSAPLTPVAYGSGKRRGELAEDEGVLGVTAEALAKLKPVLPDGVVTSGMQTYPADGAAGMVVAGCDSAFSREGAARLLATGFARVEKAHMPQAPVPAARQALADAGLSIGDVHVVTTHTPFAVNDLWLAAETGFPLHKMNPYGCSLVWGHPQGPTGARAIHELVHALRARGGGIGLFTGCAAGDTAGAAVVRVD